PANYFECNPVINAAISRMYDGINGATFEEVANNLRTKDPYMVLADFADYQRAQADVSRAYKDAEAFNRMSLNNIAGAGLFSADRAVTEYANNIWEL
ncbi:MAG: glycogen/starch/alpha-glucan phosphorylase, partial [Oscillospiraceae bacterium]